MEDEYEELSVGIFAERRKLLVLGGLLILLLFTCLIALVIGAYNISVGDVFRTLLRHLGLYGGAAEADTLQSIVVWEVRLPRIILAALVGITLAVAGGVFQGCFRNPLVDTFILGVASGSAFGAALAIVIPSFFLSLQLSAFLFGALAVAAAYFAARVRGETPVVTLILAGVIIGSVFDALVAMLQYFARDAALREIVFWLMGGFYYSTWKDVLMLAPFTIASTLFLWGMGWKLNILSMGDEEARALGIHTERLKAVLIAVATLATAVAVSLVGIIAWVGLLMPHAARMLLGPDHRYMLPGAALLGATYMVVCDTLARTLTSAEIPVGILTSLVGAPFLIILLRSKAGAVFGGSP